MYSWATFFDEGATKVPHAKSYQHFWFSSEHPKKAFVKSSSKGVEKEVAVLRSNHNLLETFPSTITPTGLSHERQLYLYEKICEFGPENVSIIHCMKLVLPVL